MVGFEALRALQHGARDRQSPAKSPRENRVNQSGSVALSTEAMRGPPWRNSLIIMALFPRDYEPGGRGFKSCRARQFSKAWNSKPSPPSCCGTSYPQVLADTTQFKDLAGKTRSSCPAVGLCGTSRGHVRAGRWRRVTAFVCHFGREADSPASAGDQHRHSHNDRPLNDWHGRAVLRDPLRKRRLRANETRTNDEDRGREPTAVLLRVALAASRCCSSY